MDWICHSSSSSTKLSTDAEEKELLATKRREKDDVQLRMSHYWKKKIIESEKGIMEKNNQQPDYILQAGPAQKFGDYVWKTVANF